MRLTLAVVAVFAVAVLSAGVSNAAPLILRCNGIATYESAYEATVARVAAQRYYRVDEQHFSRFTSANVVWSANYCTVKGARCSTDENTLELEWRDRRDAMAVKINRKSGRVIEMADGANFIGDCAPSADPAQSGGPNKF